MSSKNKKSLVPKRRFPSFVGAWETKTLGQLGKFVGGGTPSKERPEYWRGNLPWISSSDIFEDDIRTISVNKFINRQAVADSATKAVPKDSVLFVSRVGVGKLAVTNQEIYTSQDFTNFFSEEIQSHFLAYYFLANKPVLTGIVQGTSIKGFAKDDLASVRISFPQRAEQQKIADCLSSVDEMIAAQGKKVEVLREQKKALTQSLFPREGQSAPGLRFPKFRAVSKWIESKLEKYIEEFRERSSVQDEYEVLTSSRGGLIKQRDYYENSRITERENIGFNIIPPDYITYRSRSDDGLFFFNQNNLGITGIISIYYPVFRMAGGDNRFFIYLSSWFAEAIGKNSVGNAQRVLSLNELRKIALPIPSLEEQQRIADCLSSLDELIAAHIQKLDLLKEHKRALMQQLFPTTEDVGER